MYSAIHLRCGREGKGGRVAHGAASHLRFPPHCVGFSAALCWHTHLTISLSFRSSSLSSLTPAQWILLGPRALISLPLSVSLASVLLRGCSDRESREDLSKGCCCQVNGKSFTCLFEALLKRAWSFITNWPYGLLSFMAWASKGDTIWSPHLL